MPPDDDEITRPGTPKSLSTMRELVKSVATLTTRVNVMCACLDRIEGMLTAITREGRQTKATAERALTVAQQSAHAARFTDKRVDSLTLRVQKAENGQR